MTSAPVRRRMPAWAWRASLLVAAWALAGCADTLAPVYHIATTGYVERGATLTLTLYDRGSPVPSNEVTWMVGPARVATLVGAGEIQLADTGRATILARVAGATTVLPITVALPPTILVDLQDSDGVGNRDVYRTALDGSALTRLSSGAADNEQPTAGGGTIIFTSFRDGYAALYSVSATGGTESRLTAAPAPASQPSLSADGRRLAFISPSGGIDHLWTANADGSSAVVATGSGGFAGAIQASPAWAPVGDTVAVVTTQFGNAAIAQLALATGSQLALTDGTTTDLSPAWSPDGRTIAFASTRDGDLGVFVLTVSTGAVKRLTPSPGTAGEPTWLQDGRLVYTSTTGASTQLRWMDPSHPDSGHIIPTPPGRKPPSTVGAAGRSVGAGFNPTMVAEQCGK